MTTGRINQVATDGDRHGLRRRPPFENGYRNGPPCRPPTTAPPKRRSCRIVRAISHPHVRHNVVTLDTDNTRTRATCKQIPDDERTPSDCRCRSGYVSRSEHPLRGRNTQDYHRAQIPKFHTRPTHFQSGPRRRRTASSPSNDDFDTRCLHEHACAHYPAVHLLFRQYILWKHDDR
jgi:hypothetical protein